MTILSLPTTIDGTHTIRFVGILDHQAIAYCELALTNDQAHVATLFSVFVDPAHRAQGYASRLVSAALEAAQAHDKNAVNLRVHEANTAALKLYEKAIFEEHRRDEEGFISMVK